MTGKSRETLAKDKELRAQAKLKEEKRKKEEAGLFEPVQAQKVPFRGLFSARFTTRLGAARGVPSPSSAIIPMLDGRWGREDGLEYKSKAWSSPPSGRPPDLRDGNQALANPITVDQKLAFRLLAKCGFKQIETAFPAASETKFSFVRYLIEHDEIPNGVWIQVSTPAREDLMRQTFDAVAGAKHVIIRIYHATAAMFRNVVFENSKEKNDRSSNTP
ncbi:hypothetical protein J3R83DRAFT_11382 [Lanmaoa asiatica]|nr:hypothetical protein J3R83DRAFT_11382 [Lanmaoa asiatica]